MHETDDAPAPEQSDEQDTNSMRRAADQRLRTFRIGADNPLLVLPDERRDDPLPRDDGAAT